MKEPLAQRLRPRTLDEVCGQRHLLAPGQVFRRTIDRGVIPNMIFYGPSGVGKTTVASIIAANSGMRLYKLNGTTASTSDIKSVLGDIGTLNAANGILLYLDEIQYFNKRQQQSLLECVEQGTVTLIASTTENPYFYVYNALLSRCTVFEFKSLTAEDIAEGVKHAAQRLGESDGTRWMRWNTWPKARAAICARRWATWNLPSTQPLCRMARGWLRWKWSRRWPSVPPCDTIKRAMTIMILFRPIRSRCAGRTRMQRCTIWPGCWKRGTCPAPAAG